MIIQTTSAAVSRRVAHLDAVKRELSITGSSEDEDILEAIDAVSAEFARVLGREPWFQSYLVQMPGDGGTFLRVPVWPMAEVPSLIREGVDSPAAVTASDYELAFSDSHGGQYQDRVYKSDFWTETPRRPHNHYSAQERELYYEVTCKAGWAMPIYRWQASTAARVGEWTRSTDRSVSVRFECTTAGTTGASEPTWDTTDGNTTADSGATWTARLALEMPENLARAALFAAAETYRDGLETGAPAGVKSEAWDGERIVYDSGASGDSFLPAISSRIIGDYANVS